MDSPARTRNFTTVAFSLFQRFAVTDSTPKVHRRHHGGRPCSCRLRSRRGRLRSPTPHDKTSYRSRIRNSRTNRQEMVNIPLLVGNAKRQTTDLDCLIDLARRQVSEACIQARDGTNWKSSSGNGFGRLRRPNAGQSSPCPPWPFSAWPLLCRLRPRPSPTAWPRPPIRLAWPLL